MGRRTPMFYNKVQYVALINNWFGKQQILLKRAAFAKHCNDKKKTNRKRIQGRLVLKH